MSPCSKLNISLASGKLRDKKHREHFTPGAIEAFLEIADSWLLTVDQRRVLLGEISRPTYHIWKSGKLGVLSRDQLERVTLIIDINRYLTAAFDSQEEANSWLGSSNKDTPFKGRSPLCHSLQGSIIDLYATRDYLRSFSQSVELIR